MAEAEIPRADGAAHRENNCSFRRILASPEFFFIFVYERHGACVHRARAARILRRDPIPRNAITRR